MSVLKNIKSFFKADKNQQALRFFAQTIGANNTAFKETEQLLSNYSFVCIDKIADLTAQQNYYVGTFNKELNTFDEVTETENWLVKLLNENSLTMQVSFRNMLKLAVQWLYIEGNVYIWARQSNLNGGIKSKYPIEFILLPSREVQIETSENDFISSYNLTLNNRYVKIPANEVIHIKSMAIPFGSDNQDYYYRGTPKFLNALKDVISAYYSMLQNANYELNRQGVPNIVLKNDKFGITQQEISDWQTWADRRFKQYAPSVLGLQDGTEYERMDVGNNILAQNTGAFAGGLNTELKQLITATFGIPLDFLNGSVAYTSNYKELKATIYEQTINPLTQTIIEAFNYHFKQFDNGLYSIQFTPYQYSSLTDKVMIINTLTMIDAISKNEVRDMLGLETLPEYDEDAEIEVEEDVEVEDIESPENDTEDETDIQKIIKQVVSSELKKKVI